MNADSRFAASSSSRYLFGLLNFSAFCVLLVIAPIAASAQIKVQRDAPKGREAELSATVDRLHGEGRFTEAIAPATELVAVRKVLYGEKHPTYVSSLNNLAVLYGNLKNFARAEPLQVEALKIRKELLGPKHPDYATSLNNLAGLYRSMADYARAEALYVEALAIRKEVFGTKHPDYAASLNNLAVLHKGMGDYARAEPLYVEARDIFKEIVGTKHPLYAMSLNNLAMLYYRTGEFARAEPLYVEAREILKDDPGTQHPDYASTLNNLAMLYWNMGRYAQAEPLFFESLKIKQDSVGKKHPAYAQSLNNLAFLYTGTGDYARAEPLYIEALAIKKEVLGAKHPDYATSLSNMALMYDAMQDYAKAELLQVEALAILKAALGAKHHSYATGRANLAGIYKNQGDYARAEAIYLDTLATRKEILGTKHADYATSLNNLALLYVEQGDYARAAPLYAESAAALKEALGAKHPDYAVSLTNLARLHEITGDHGRAEPLYREALEISRASLEATALIQSERQQLAMGQSLRLHLDKYVSLGASTGRYDRRLFAQVLLWKGATLVRQRSMRLAADDSAVRELFIRLQRTATQLASLSRTAPEKETEQAAWRVQLSDLTHEKERLEADLSAKSAAFRRATKEITLDDLLASLPKDAVLIDYLEYDRSTPPRKKGEQTQWDRQIVAFVVRHAEREVDQVRLITLGSVAPVSAAIDAWRSTFGMDPAGATAGRTLRAAIWQPLVEHLGEAKTVLVSTDGVLGRLPLGALPGKEPGTYLFEDHRLALLPVPQLLPTLVNAEGKRALAKELLLLGDVDYDAPPGDDAARKKKRPRRAGESRSPADATLFEPLSGAAGEIASLKELYGQLFEVKTDDPRVLVKSHADEARFRTLAPQYRHLHLATHGFFAGEQFASALNSRRNSRTDRTMLADREFAVSGHIPGLLSGLVLTGANLEPSPSGDDGILTSQEIGVMDLSRVDTVVLSACDTGLGETAGGEGLLGVQRAFQTAGARTTVASFWKVDDLATRFLMERFYRNLWEKEMSRLDALREAQLYILKHPEEIRGAARLADPSPVQPHALTSPKYWAAFSLSGDWR